MTQFLLDLLPYLPGFHNKATDTSCGRELSLRAPVSPAPGPHSGLPHDHHSAAPTDPPKSLRGALALPPASAAVWQGPLRPGLPSRPGHSRPKRTVRGEGRSDRRGGLRRGAGKERPAGARPPQRSRRGSGPRRRQAPGPSRAPRQAGPRRGERVLAGGSAGPGAAVPVPAEPCGGRSGAGRSGTEAGSGSGSGSAQAGGAAAGRQGAPKRSWLPAAPAASGRELDSGPGPGPVRSPAASRPRLPAGAAGPDLPRRRRAGARALSAAGTAPGAAPAVVVRPARLRPGTRPGPLRRPARSAARRAGGEEPATASRRGRGEHGRPVRQPSPVGPAAKGERLAAASPVCPSGSDAPNLNVYCKLGVAPSGLGEAEGNAIPGPYLRDTQRAKQLLRAEDDLCPRFCPERESRLFPVLPLF